MRLKMAKDACEEQLLRGGFEDMKRYSSFVEMILCGDKPGEAYDVWFPRDEFRRDWFVKIYKGTVAGSNVLGDWDLSNTIILRLA